MADKVWVVVINGRKFDLRDFPIGRLEQIAQDSGDSQANWATVVTQPLSDGRVAEAVVRSVADWFGPETQLPSALTVREVMPMFELVDDDLPSEPASGDPTDGGDPSTPG